MADQPIQISRDLQRYMLGHVFPGWDTFSVSYTVLPGGVSSEIVFSYHGITWALWDKDVNTPEHEDLFTPGMFLGLHTAYLDEGPLSYLYTDGILEYDFDVLEYTHKDVMTRIQNILTGFQHEDWAKIYSVAVPNRA